MGLHPSSPSSPVPSRPRTPISLLFLLPLLFYHVLAFNPLFFFLLFHYFLLLPYSLHPYSSAFFYGSKRVITEIQARPMKDHRGIKAEVQFSAGVPTSEEYMMLRRLKFRAHVSSCCYVYKKYFIEFILDLYRPMSIYKLITI